MGKIETHLLTTEGMNLKPVILALGKWDLKVLMGDENNIKELNTEYKK